MIFNCDAQPSVIAYGDASSLDAKTQFVASYMRREKLFGRANVALRLREHIKVRVSKYNYISPERGGGCEHSEQTEGLGYSLFTLCKLILIHVKKDYNHV